MSVTVGSITLYSGDVIRLLDQFSGKYLKLLNSHDDWYSGDAQLFVAAELPAPQVSDQADLASFAVFINEDNSVSFLASNKKFWHSVYHRNLAVITPDNANDSANDYRRYYLESGGGDIVYIKLKPNNKYLKTMFSRYNLTCPIADAIDGNLGKYKLFKTGVYKDMKEEIVSITYDFDKALKSVTPLIIGRGTYRNPTGATLSDSLSATEEVTVTKSFTFGAGFSFGVEVTTSVGVPLVAESEVTLSSEISFTFEHSTSTENKKATTNALGVSVPPHSNIRAYYEIKKGVCDVPFVATIRRVDFSGKVYQFTVSGMYEGVNVIDSSIRTENFEG